MPPARYLSRPEGRLFLTPKRINNMQNYLDLLQDILDNGTRQANRTGIDAISLPGAMLKFNMAEGFPIVTTKKLAFNACKGELLAFLRGYTNAADFRRMGCNFWDQNANENKAWLSNTNRDGDDDLGRIYGAQWRDWRTTDGEGNIDQVAEAIYQIKHNPTNRRIIINAWRPDEFHLMALPPCHVLYQFIVNVERGTLNLCMYQRSCDMFLGVPMNISSAALLLSIMAELTGYRPGVYTHFLADAHIYVNHVDQVKEQLTREPYSLPELVFVREGKDIERFPTWTKVEDFEPHHIQLRGYQHHPAIKAEMAV